MTPLQLFIICLVIFLFIFILDRDNEAPIFLKALGGFSILGMLGSIIWGILYYIKL